MERNEAITYINPRTIDGEPDFVAGEAATQALIIAELMDKAFIDTYKMAMNSALTEYYKDHEAMSADEVDVWWAAQPIAKSLDKAHSDFLQASKRLRFVQMTLTFDPNAPLPEE